MQATGASRALQAAAALWLLLLLFLPGSVQSELIRRKSLRPVKDIWWPIGTMDDKSFRLQQITLENAQFVHLATMGGYDKLRDDVVEAWQNLNGQADLSYSFGPDTHEGSLVHGSIAVKAHGRRSPPLTSYDREEIQKIVGAALDFQEYRSKSAKPAPKSSGYPMMRQHLTVIRRPAGKDWFRKNNYEFNDKEGDTQVLKILIDIGYVAHLVPDE